MSRRERRKEKLRADIVEAGMALFGEVGFAAATMEHIAARADVAKATLYSYFPCKEAIVGGYLRHEMQRRGAEMDDAVAGLPDTRARLLAMFQAITAWQAANRELVRHYVGWRLAEAARAGGAGDGTGFDRHLLKVILRGQEDGELRRDVDAEALVSVLRFAFLSTLLGWLDGPEEGDLIAAARQMVGLFLDGAGGRAA